MKKVIWYEGCGVDYDTAYFLTYGKHPLPNYDKEPYIPNADFDRDNSNEAYSEYQQSNFDEYFTGSYRFVLFK